MKFYSLLFLFLTLISPNANSSAPVANQSQNCKFLGENLYGCKQFECATFSGTTSEIITQNIQGKNDDGECIVEQKFSNGEKIICNYQEESRKFMAIKMQDSKNGAIGKNIDDIEYTKALMEEIFLSECIVYDADGKIAKDVLKKPETIDFKSKARVKKIENQIINLKK